MLHENLSNASGAREGDLVDLGVLAELFADGLDVLVSEDNADDTFGDSCAAGELDNGQDGVRSF